MDFPCKSGLVRNTVEGISEEHVVNRLLHDLRDVVCISLGERAIWCCSDRPKEPSDKKPNPRQDRCNEDRVNNSFECPCSREHLGTSPRTQCLLHMPRDQPCTSERRHRWRGAFFSALCLPAPDKRFRRSNVIINRQGVLRKQHFLRYGKLNRQRL
jgi:hypothetical protein